MEMLCIAAEADPTGFVLVNGRTPTTTDLARMTGEPEAVVQSALEELDRNGVFSRDRSGRIYSRRIVRDAKASAINQKNGREGGNPEIRRGTVPKADRVRPYRRTDNPAKTRRIFERGGGKCHWCGVGLVWQSDKLVPNLFHVDHVIAVCDGGTNDEDNLVSACALCNHARARKDWIKPPDTNPDKNSDKKPHKPEARSQKETERIESEKQTFIPNGRAPTGAVIDFEFDEFWRVYPRRDDRGHAVKAFKAARRKVDQETLIAAARRYAQSRRGQDQKFTAMAGSWLNGERWLDEPEQQSASGYVPMHPGAGG